MVKQIIAGSPPTQEDLILEMFFQNATGVITHWEIYR